MTKAIVRNLKTGKRAEFIMPFHLSDLSKIGIDDSYEGQVYVESGFDSFGFGSDGYMYLYELEAFIKSYENQMNPYHFDYMMLSRLQSDCDYFLGYGNGDIKRLWGNNIEDHIAEMKKIWKKFPEDLKPEWLTENDILMYESKMKEMVNI